MPSFGAPPSLLSSTEHTLGRAAACRYSSPRLPSPCPFFRFPFASLLSSPRSAAQQQDESETRRAAAPGAGWRVATPGNMELFYELLLTAAASLLVAFLLARLLAAAAAGSDPLGERDRGAVEEVEQDEERIIEVDELRVKEPLAREDVAEGWIQVRKASAEAEGEHEEEEAPAKTARELVPGDVLEDRREEGQVGEERRGLTAATEAVVEVQPHSLGVEAAPKEVLDVALEKEKVQDVGVEQHDLIAEVAPSEVHDTELEKLGVPVIEAVEVKRQHDLGAEVAPSDVLEVGLEKQGIRIIEAVEVMQQHVLALPAPVEVFDEGLDERGQVVEAGSCGLTSETVPIEVLDALSEKEVQVIEEKHHQLAAETNPRAIFDVALTAKDEQSVEEAVNVHEEFQSKDEAKCEPHLFDQEEGLVSEEELVGRKTDHVETSHESSSSGKVPAELEEDTTLQGFPADEAETDMEFGEWEGIERSEVEKRFGAAAAFAYSDAGMAALSKLGSDVQLQLQGLLKVAVDGPCYDSTQPLTLRPSSRAKWYLLFLFLTL
ncbi:hypothetical protein GUJ93_ZPchr0006g45136 [Zizania palustris]|uniref:Uncharacterized protein n=1 Tax=Zizania palustris TaxID=103762 RepID=A0A8J5SK36_ZIZPA|nr:hypothetical protein GUJ93_ZPchr0006g45136 [Zizania palustris]